MLLCIPTLNIGFCYPCGHNRPRLYKRSSFKWTWRLNGTYKQLSVWAVIGLTRPRREEETQETDRETLQY